MICDDIFEGEGFTKMAEISPPVLKEIQCCDSNCGHLIKHLKLK